MIPFLILNLAGLTVIAILLLSYRSEKRALCAFARSSVPSSATIFGRALDLAGRVYVQIPRSTDPRFIPVAALDIIGGTPISILRRGGCCSGLTRVYVTGLGTLGIKAAQVSLYHATGKSQHALAEVSLGAHHVIVDPTYGFYYVDGHGTPIGLAELRQGIKPEYRKLPHSERRPPRGLRTSESYPANDYYNFDFSCTKTANWTKTVVRRSAYRLLRVLTRGRIDTLRQPLWMEWPQIIVATSVAAGVLLLDFTMWLLYGLDNQLLA
jgi:hypothetical protein